MNSHMLDSLVPLKQAGELLDVSYATVHKWVTTGVQGRKLKAYRKGGRWYTSATAIDEFLVSNQQETEPPKRGISDEVKENLAKIYG